MKKPISWLFYFCFIMLHFAEDEAILRLLSRMQIIAPMLYTNEM